MSSSRPEGTGSPGLRERKKARTRAAIQHHALRLFAEQGYERTTVEQIAAAADISASTFFRYFPTKEDVVVTDDYDPLLVSLIAAQPPGVPLLTALREALRVALVRLSAEEIADVRARARLMISVPALRARIFDNVTTTTEVIGAAVAERIGRSADDPAVRALAAACTGVWTDAVLRWATSDAALDLVATLDQALAHLESGLRL